jgi:hypothetical protein
MPQGMDPVKLQAWMERIDRFRNSSQSVARFCASENVSQPSFYHWKKRLSTLNNQSGRQSTSTKTTAAGNHSTVKATAAKTTTNRNGRTTRSESLTFQPVQITPPLSDPQNTTIRLPGGIEIQVGSDLRVVESIVKLLLDDRALRDGSKSC